MQVYENPLLGVAVVVIHKAPHIMMRQRITNEAITIEWTMQGSEKYWKELERMMIGHPSRMLENFFPIINGAAIHRFASVVDTISYRREVTDAFAIYRFEYLLEDEQPSHGMETI